MYGYWWSGLASRTRSLVVVHSVLEFHGQLVAELGPAVATLHHGQHLTCVNKTIINNITNLTININYITIIYNIIINTIITNIVKTIIIQLYRWTGVTGSRWMEATQDRSS